MRTLAQTLDELKLMRGNSHGRRWFYEYLLSKGLVEENHQYQPGGRFLPTQKSLSSGYAAIESTTPPYVEWSFDFVRYQLCDGENRSVCAGSEMHDAYYSVSKFCNPDYMDRPFSRAELLRLLSPYLEETGEPTASVLSNGHARYSEPVTIYRWVEEKLLLLYREFLGTLTEDKRRKSEKDIGPA